MVSRRSIQDQKSAPVPGTTQSHEFCGLWAISDPTKVQKRHLGDAGAQQVANEARGMVGS